MPKNIYEDKIVLAVEKGSKWLIQKLWIRTGRGLNHTLWEELIPILERKHEENNFQKFTAVAVSENDDGELDIWTINERKQIVHVTKEGK